MSHDKLEMPSRKAITVTVILWLIVACSAEYFIVQSGNVGLIVASISFIFGATAIVAALLLLVCTESSDEAQDS